MCIIKKQLHSKTNGVEKGTNYTDAMTLCFHVHIHMIVKFKF